MKVLTLALLTLALSLVPSLVGCTSTEEMNIDVKDGSVMSLCSGCGQIKGSDACCNESAETCAKCDLAKGSPGCCKMTKGAVSMPLCDECGHIKGTAVCCLEGLTTCIDCGFAKGSPACCQ